MPVFSRIAQIWVVRLLVTWKMKYLPSAVQFPQHSAAGRFQSGSQRRKLEPSGATSHSELERKRRSYTLKRSRLPSGDQRRYCGLPASVTSLRGWAPSLFTEYMSLPFTKTICPPSGDQVAACAEMSPRERGDPPSNGATHNGLSNSPPLASAPEPATSISDRLGERS